VAFAPEGRRLATGGADGAVVLWEVGRGAEKELRGQLKHGANRKAAELVGQRIAAKAKEKGIESVAFDRAGYRYHGRIKALADAAREAGLKF